MGFINYVAREQPSVPLGFPLGLLRIIAFLASYLFPSMHVKAEEVIMTVFMAVDVQTSASKTHHKVFVYGGSMQCLYLRQVKLDTFFTSITQTISHFTIKNYDWLTGIQLCIAQQGHYT